MTDERCAFCKDPPMDEVKLVCARHFALHESHIFAMDVPNQTYGIHGPLAAVHISEGDAENDGVWCGEYRYRSTTRHPSEASCESCLRAVCNWGKNAKLRLMQFGNQPGAETHDPGDEDRR